MREHDIFGKQYIEYLEVTKKIQSRNDEAGQMSGWVNF